MANNLKSAVHLPVPLRWRRAIRKIRSNESLTSLMEKINQTDRTEEFHDPTQSMVSNSSSSSPEVGDDNNNIEMLLQLMCQDLLSRDESGNMVDQPEWPQHLTLQQILGSCELQPEETSTGLFDPSPSPSFTASESSSPQSLSTAECSPSIYPEQPLSTYLQDSTLTSADRNLLSLLTALTNSECSGAYDQLTVPQESISSSSLPSSWDYQQSDIELKREPSVAEMVSTDSAEKTKGSQDFGEAVLYNTAAIAMNLLASSKYAIDTQAINNPDYVTKDSDLLDDDLTPEGMEESIKFSVKGVSYQREYHRWKCTWHANDKQNQKYFSAKKLGFRKAKRMAVEWKIKMEREEGNKTGRRYDESRHVSNVKGVAFNSANRWYASWYDAGRQRHLYFGVEEYGFETAKRLATIARWEAERTGAMPTRDEVEKLYHGTNLLLQSPAISALLATTSSESTSSTTSDVSMPCAEATQRLLPPQIEHVSNAAHPFASQSCN